MSYRVVLVCLLVVAAGCGGGGGSGSEEGPLVVSATPASVGDAALSETGYELAERGNRTRNTTVTLEIQGDIQAQPTFDVRATSHRAVYERRVAGGVAAFGVLAVPGVKPSDALANPVHPFGDRGVAENVTAATTYESVRDVRPTGNGTVRLLGNETRLKRYAATATYGGSSTSVRIAVATVRDGGDFVTVVAVYPRGADEADAVERLVAGVRR